MKPSDRVRAALREIGIDDTLHPDASESDWRKWLDFFEAPETRTCPECGAPLYERNGEYGAFWGCSNFPACRHTESV